MATPTQFLKGLKKQLRKNLTTIEVAKRGGAKPQLGTPDATRLLKEKVVRNAAGKTPASADALFEKFGGLKGAKKYYAKEALVPKDVTKYVGQDAARRLMEYDPKKFIKPKDTNLGGPATVIAAGIAGARKIKEADIKTRSEQGNLEHDKRRQEIMNKTGPKSLRSSIATTQKGSRSGLTGKGPHRYRSAEEKNQLTKRLLKAGVTRPGK